jgi:S1-C subfamily serine protease
VDAGVYVAFVEKDSPAARAGVPRDVVLTRVDDAPITAVEDVQSALRSAGPVLLRVQRRDGTSAFYEVK